jgi:hypothetical protein
LLVAGSPFGVGFGVAAMAGWAVDTFGAHGGFAVAATASGVMAVLAVAGLRALRGAVRG